MNVGTHLFDEALEQGARIARVIDGEVWVVPEALGLAAKNHHAGRVKGLEPHSVGVFA